MFCLIKLGNFIQIIKNTGLGKNKAIFSTEKRVYNFTLKLHYNENVVTTKKCILANFEYV